MQLELISPTPSWTPFPKWGIVICFMDLLMMMLYFMIGSQRIKPSTHLGKLRSSNCYLFLEIGLSSHLWSSSFIFSVPLCPPTRFDLSIPAGLLTRLLVYWTAVWVPSYPSTHTCPSLSTRIYRLINPLIVYLMAVFMLLFLFPLCHVSGIAEGKWGKCMCLVRLLIWSQKPRQHFLWCLI